MEGCAADENPKASNLHPMTTLKRHTESCQFCTRWIFKVSDEAYLILGLTLCKYRILTKKCVEFDRDYVVTFRRLVVKVTLGTATISVFYFSTLMCEVVN